MSNVREHFFENMIKVEDINGEIKKRENIYQTESIAYSEVDQWIEKGWEIDTSFKKTHRLRKKKDEAWQFEDRVWVLFAKLGFHILNKDRNFRIPYQNNADITQQIDVFAADDETMFVIECKAAKSQMKTESFKKLIDALGGQKQGIFHYLDSIYPDQKFKKKIIFVTKNYEINQIDKNRLKHYDIFHFDEQDIEYYEKLVRHLGTSARYQLLGTLFEGQKIPGLDMKIPAIRGKMGGHNYYMFSIQPKKLLKVGYILHKSRYNSESFQRIIKRNRLTKIKKFIEEGGFFPNSIIVNIKKQSKKNIFEKSNNQLSKSISTLGFLNLPNEYQSVYIIDGQHRLYGYSDSKYEENNTIPVVAFEDLEGKEQINLFMQINENQKAVSKNLRNTLNAELLWDSPSLKEKHDAIKLKIAQQLGEDKNSALYNRVQLGEETSSQRNITIDSIKIGLDHSNFIGEFSKNEVKKAGLLYYGKKEKTLDSLFNLVKEYLYYIKSELPFEWDKTESSSGVVVINASIIALLMLFSDIVNHVRITRHIDIKDYSPEQLIDFIKPFMKPVIEYYKNISKEERVRIKNSYYGAAGRRIYWRKLQEKVHAHYPEFCPNGLEDYLSDKQKNYRLDTQRIISEIEEFLSNDFKSRLIDKYGESGGAWYKKGWPEKVYTDASKIAIEKNRAVVEEENEYQPWQCLVLINYRDIALYNDNWETLFKEKYTTPEEEQTNKSKKQKTVWMVKLNEIRNKAFHVGDNINEDEHGFVRNIKEWLFSD